MWLIDVVTASTGTLPASKDQLPPNCVTSHLLQLLQTFLVQMCQVQLLLFSLVKEVFLVKARIEGRSGGSRGKVMKDAGKVPNPTNEVVRVDPPENELKS